MIRARLNRGNGRTVVLLGLTYENMARLSADEPIIVDSAAPSSELGLEIPDGPLIWIVAGKTESDILAKLKTVGLDPAQAATLTVDPRVEADGDA